MSRFLCDLKLTLLRGHFRSGRQLFRLDAPLLYESDLLGAVIEVPQGFITDMASVPKLPLAWLLAGGTANEAAVVHDWLYTAHAAVARPVTRRQADAIFREAIPASEDPNAPAFLMWLAVRAAGWISWRGEGPSQPVHVRDALAARAPIEAP